MNVSLDQTVRELALESPTAAGVFEKMGIDYCCGGKKTLAQACSAAGVEAGNVVSALNAAESARAGAGNTIDWKSAPLAELIRHIQVTHHEYTRKTIARLGPLFDKVCAAHGEKHPELLELRQTFAGLAGELSPHLMKEELVLFPYVERMEESVLEGAPIVPPPFGSVRNPVMMMEHEHDSAGEALLALREGTHGFEPPPDACTSYKSLLQALAEFEADLHRHIHLENNILFPRAMEMEKSN